MNKKNPNTINMTFKLTFKQQFLVVQITIIKYLLLIFLFWYLGYELSVGMIMVWLGIFVIDLLPAIVLHINYFINDLGSELTIDRGAGTLFYRNSKNNRLFNLADAVELNHVVSIGGASTYTGWYAFGDYSFCEIQLRNGEKLIITCLMVNHIKQTLEILLKMKANTKMRLLPIIRRGKIITNRNHIAISENTITTTD